MIVCTDIKKSFPLTGGRKVSVLDGIDLSISKGEMVAIKGASGSGKSTLLHILGCLDRPTSGTYFLDGIDIGHLSQNKLAELRNKRIGFVMQHFALIDDESVIKNVEVPLLFSAKPKLRTKERAFNILDKLGIEHLTDMKVNKLSGGEKQRVAIARALISNPDIILADEPTGALDSVNSKLIMDIFASLNESGKTILIVTHDDNVAKRCKKTIFIRDGKISLDIDTFCDEVYRMDKGILVKE